MYELVLGIGAALAFPIIVVSIYHRRELRRNRKAGVRRTQKIKLVSRGKDPGDSVQ